MPSVKFTARSIGSLRFLVQDRPQQPAFDPLNHHVKAAALFAVIGLDHARMVKFLANLLLALEALHQNRIVFHLSVRNFDGHPLAIEQGPWPDRA